MKKEFAVEMGQHSHKESPRDKEFYQKMNRNSQKTRFGGKTKEEISEIMRQVSLKRKK